MTTELQKAWDLLQPIIHSKLAPMEYFEWGETFCKFKKNGKFYEVKIKELKNE